MQSPTVTHGTSSNAVASRDAVQPATTTAVTPQVSVPMRRVGNENGPPQREEGATPAARPRASRNSPRAKLPDVMQASRTETALLPYNAHAAANTGNVTDIDRYAPVSAAIAAQRAQNAVPPHAQRTLANRMWGIAYGAVSANTPAQWMANTMRGVRAQACDAPGADSKATPTTLLRHMTGARPVNAFWNSDSMKAVGGLGAAQPQVLDWLDRFAQQSSPHVALSLSFACREAIQKLDGLGSRQMPAALDELRQVGATRPLSDIVNAERTVFPGAPAGLRHTRAEPSPARVAREVLSSYCESNQFLPVAQKLMPHVPEAELRNLRTLLQAEAATPLPMAARVRANARAELAHGPQALDSHQKFENFLWNNGFRDDGPDSALAEAKSHFFDGLEQLSREPHEPGPMRALYENGIGGAHRHLLADEEGKLRALLRGPDGNASPALASLVGDIGQSLVAGINGERRALRNSPRDLEGQHGADASQASEALVEMLADALHLQSWHGAAAAAKPLDELVHGQRHDTAAGGAERATLEALCARVLQGGGNVSAADLGGGAAAAGASEQATRQAGLLADRVHQKLQSVQLGVRGLQDMTAKRGVVPQPGASEMLAKARGIVEATPLLPAANTPHAVGEMFAEFLIDVQFGNHGKASEISSAGVSTRGLAANISPLLHPDDPHAAQKPLLARLDLRYEGTKENVLRAGAATHGGELFIGQETRQRGSGGGGLHAGRTAWGDSGTLGRISGGGDITLLARETSDYDGAMFRVDRRVTADQPETADAPPIFTQSDPQVRATMAEMGRMLFGTGGAHAATKEQREAFFEGFATRFMDQGLSLTMLHQHSSALRSEIGGGVGGSMTTSTSPFGGRFGASLSYGFEKGWRFSTTEKDETGSYRINNLRVGWQGRHRVNADLGGNAYFPENLGVPPTTLAGITRTMGEGGGSARTRVPTREGNIVPEKAFSDTETPDKDLFREIVLAHGNKDKWIDLFAYKYRAEGPAEARRKGEADVDNFFVKADSVHEGNHVYYARERMHPDVSQRLDELKAVEEILGRQHGTIGLDGLKAEVADKRQRLSADDRSWGAASLIAYQRSVSQDGQSASVAGVRGTHQSAVEAEREFIFDTIGWPNLRQRERENPPTHLDE